MHKGIFHFIKVGGILAICCQFGGVQAETAQEWGMRALNIQAHIDNDAPFYETTWAGTHNSFSNADDDNLYSDWTNQSMSLKQQLDSGIRELVFDIHYDDDAVRLCHNNTGFQLWGYGSCVDSYTGNRKLTNALDDLVEWLDDGHRGEVILLKVELAESGEENINKVHKQLDNIYDEYYLPSAFMLSPSDGCSVLPSVLTKSKVLASGKNIVLFSSDCYSNNTFNSMVFTSQSMMEDYKYVDDIALTRSTSTDMTRVKDGMTKGGVLYNLGILDVKPLKLKPSNVTDFLTAGLNIFETYGFGANGDDWKVDGELPVAAKDLIWSWDELTRQPNGSGSCAKLNEGSDRFYDANCSHSYIAACRKLVDINGARVTAQWALTDSNVNFFDAENACSALSDGEYVFATPRNKVELDQLLNVRGMLNFDENIWVNYQLVDNVWIADIGEADNEMQAQCNSGGNQAVCGVIAEYLSLLDNSSI
ncbi:hypothetical protein [uncultured Shewanella sp.]|uniref:hypothetical protein n=1 Tax=uncultured Shewanella sp. TaxID=173975 RepID=UPI0026246711|nr:hypothetical protein [uncultured Shewanella sp.]